MGIATHLGPWVLGTVRSTTGTTPGLIRNTGATTVIQTATVTVASGTTTTGFVTTNLCTLPAGAVIHAIILDTVTAITAVGSNTVTFQTGNATTGLSTNFAAATSLATVTGSGSIAQGRATATPTAGNLAIFNNIGTTDVTIQMAITLGATSSGSAGVLNVQVVYAVRQPDGTYVPTATTGP